MRSSRPGRRCSPSDLRRRHERGPRCSTSLPPPPGSSSSLSSSPTCRLCTRPSTARDTGHFVSRAAPAHRRGGRRSSPGTTRSDLMKELQPLLCGVGAMGRGRCGKSHQLSGAHLLSLTASASLVDHRSSRGHGCGCVAAVAVAQRALPREARLCLRMGFSCLRYIADLLRHPYDPDPLPDDPIELILRGVRSGCRATAAGRLPNGANAGGSLAALQRMARQLRVPRLRAGRPDRRSARAVVGRAKSPSRDGDHSGAASRPDAQDPTAKR